MEIIVGPPGTGKTTKLLSIVEQELANEVEPSRIAFVSFTRKAAEVAAHRAMEQFALARADLPYFRTLHSLAFRELALSQNSLMTREHYEELGEMIGIDFRHYGADPEEGLQGATDGDGYLALDTLARTRGIDLREQWEATDGRVDWFALEMFSRALHEYKASRALFDFTDILEQYVRNSSPLEIDVAVVDEAQDLSPLQWQMVYVAMTQASRVYIAGDDDQAIYKWSGADVDHFIALAKNPSNNTTVLGQSYRLPRKIYEFAEGITDRISNRVTKEWKPRDDEGEVDYHATPDELDFSEGTWILLARNRYQLAYLEEAVKLQGRAYRTQAGNSVNLEHITNIKRWEALRAGKQVTAEQAREIYALLGPNVQRAHRSLDGLPDDKPLTMSDLQTDHGLLTDAIWHEAFERISLARREYYVAILRNKEKLDERPRIYVGTIHSTKGDEADHVVIMTDLAYRSWQEFQNYEDDEHRVFFVGATRAKETLHIIEPRTDKFYPI